MTAGTDVSLTPDQVLELNRQLATMRHDINNYLSLIMAASEVIRRKPESAERMSATLNDQPRKVIEAMQKFTTEFEKSLGVVRP
jgi:hypothetical protein